MDQFFKCPICAEDTLLKRKEIEFDRWLGSCLNDHCREEFILDKVPRTTFHVIYELKEAGRAKPAADF